MAKAPAADQIRLLDVQAFDTKLDQLAHRKKNLPVLARLIEIDSRLSDLDAALVASRTAASDIRRELAKAETDVEQVRGRMARNEARYASGKGTAKDLQALQSELESLRRRCESLEEVQLEVMERLEAHEDTLTKATAAADAVRAERVTVGAERDNEIAGIGAEAGTIAGQRQAAAEGIEGGLVTVYERLRAKLGGIGAAPLKARRCEGCRLELNAQDLEDVRNAEPDSVVRCEECGRILVRTPESGL